MVRTRVRALGAVTALLLASAPAAHADPPWSAPAVVTGSEASGE